MGSISQIVSVFTSAIIGFIDAGSDAVEDFVGTGSTAVDGLGTIVKGALGSVAE